MLAESLPVLVGAGVKTKPSSLLEGFIDGACVGRDRDRAASNQDGEGKGGCKDGELHSDSARI